jgi:2-haloacid dehalogenase
LLAAYHQAELTLEAASSWRPYRDILTTGLRIAARHVGVPLGAGDARGAHDAGGAGDARTADNAPGSASGAGGVDEASGHDAAAAFVGAWPTMTIFEDVGPALRVLKDAGWLLAILTNCDDDLFATTAPKLPVPFDLVVTAEQVRSYKPDLGHFRRFADLTGAGPENWIHVANSWILDILPAARMGLRSVWVDRDLTGHPAKAADRRITAMRRLPEAVADVSALPAGGRG